MFSKRPRDHVAGAPPLSLCVGHFGELLEDGSSGQKALPWVFIVDDRADVIVRRIPSGGSCRGKCYQISPAPRPLMHSKAGRVR